MTKQTQMPIRMERIAFVPNRYGRNGILWPLIVCAATQLSLAARSLRPIVSDREAAVLTSRQRTGGGGRPGENRAILHAPTGVDGLRERAIIRNSLFRLIRQLFHAPRRLCGVGKVCGGALRLRLAASDMD